MNAIYSSNDQGGSVNQGWDFTSSANQESPSNKIYAQAAIRKQIIQSNPEKEDHFLILYCEDTFPGPFGTVVNK